MLREDPIDLARRNWESHGWHDAAPAMAMLTSIMRVQQLLSARVAAVRKPHALTLARYEVLMLLTFSRRGALPLGKIGERLQVHPASVTNAIDRLQAQRVVRRHPPPTDGRTTLATVRVRGRSLAQRATADMNALFAALDVDEEMFDQLRRLREAAGDAEAVR